MQLTCRAIQQFHARIEDLKKNGPNRGIIYDPDRAERPVSFIEKNIRLYEDTFHGKPFALTEWQKDIVRALYGFVYAETGYRVFREAYIQLPKKNGKTTLSAGLVCYELFCGGKGLNLYTAGTSAQSARLSYKDIFNFILASPTLNKHVHFLGKTPERSTAAICTAYNNTLYPLSADKKQDGLRVNFALIDELHLHRDRDLHDMLCASAATKMESLVVKITTAGMDINGIGYQQYCKAKDILEGKIQDDSFFVFVSEPDENDDLLSMDTARKVNLNLGITVNEQFIQNKLADAKRGVGKNPYFRYHLNKWVTASAESWLPVDKWDAVTSDFSEEMLHGNNLYLALDMSISEDLTSLTGIVPFKDKFYVLSWNWRPDGKLIDIDGEAPYELWHKEGFLLGSGDDEVITSAPIIAKIQELNTKYNLIGVAFDARAANEVYAACKRDSIEALAVPQGYSYFVEPIMKFREYILTGKLVAPKDPCMRWQFSNILLNTTSDGNMKFIKNPKNPRKRIDSMISLVMAIYLHMKRSEDETPLSVLPPDFNLRAALGI